MERILIKIDLLSETSIKKVIVLFNINNLVAKKK
jgi:hypothetical protein